MQNIKPGSILVNTSTNKLYGVLVSILPNNKIIVFRLDKNTHPIFSKLDIHPHITKVGIINEYQYSTLKNALLKYYRTYSLTPSEKKMMTPLMEFAFPIGIPEYQPNVELPERDIELMDLHSKLISGNRIMINTPNKSCYNHLNNKTVDIIEKTENGMWVNLPTNEQDTSKLGNTMSFLFYKNRETPTFGGISRITPVYGDNETNTSTNTTNMNNTNNNSNSNSNGAIIEAFKKLKENDQLSTMMEFNGDKVRLIPATRKVIFPDVYQNMIYSPHSDNFIIEKENLTPLLTKKLGNKLIISKVDSKGNLIEFNDMDNDVSYKSSDRESGYDGYGEDGTYNYKKVIINEDGELVYEGGAKKTKEGKIIVDEEFTNSNDIEDIEEYEKSIYKYKSLNTFLNEDDHYENENDNQNENDNDYNQDLENSLANTGFENEKENGSNDSGKNGESGNNNILSDIEKQNSNKIKRQRLVSNTTNTDSEYDENEFEEIIDEDNIEIQDTFEKVKKVEISELEKVFKESIQKGDLLKYKIEKLPIFKRNNSEIINNIKKEINIISLLNNNISENINGVNQIKFKQQDYKPLVSKYIKGDFTNKYLIPLVINRKKIYLNKDSKIDKEEYDLQSNEVIENFYDSINNISYIQDKKNVSLNNDVYTQKIINELNPTSINETDSLGILFRLGEKLNSNDYKRLSQDTITIKYCDKSRKCQGYSLNTMNFDYQVNLGPMGRFISSEDDENNGDGNDENNGDDNNNGDDDGNGDDENNGESKDRDNQESKKKSNKNILHNIPKFKVYYPGDLIRIIGYIRPPLHYFSNIDSNIDSNLGNTLDNNILNDLYKSTLTKDTNSSNIITINLEDINSELIRDEGTDEEDEEIANRSQFKITQYPEKFILFLMPKVGFTHNDIAPQIEKIIPSIDDIIKIYLNKTENKSVDYIYNILNKFDYDYNELTIDMYNKIAKENEDYNNLFTNLNNKLKPKFELYKKKIIKNKKQKEDNEKKFKKHIVSNDKKTDDHDKNDKHNKHDKHYEKDNFKYISNDVMDDITNFYFNLYDNKDISIDSDEIRLKWFQKNFDNGRFLFKTLLINYFKMYQETHKIENLETELAIIKEKHIMMFNNNTVLEQQKTLNHLSPNPNNIQITKNNSPNIIKYPSLERLEKDNGKVAISDDGSVIMTGDYALVSVNNTKLLYKREVIGNIDMWIKEDISILPKLIQDKRNNCIDNPELKLEEGHLYDFDMDRLKCLPKDIMTESINNMEDKHKIELQINDIQKEIDYIKQIPILIANLNKDIINDRMYLVNKVNSMKKYIKNKEDESVKYEEYIKATLKTEKPCIHFKIVEYFHNIKSEYEKYIFADNILKQFENNEISNVIGSENDYNNFNKKDNSKNFTYCNICNQQLLCNHHKLIASYLNNKSKNQHNTNHNINPSTNPNRNPNTIDYQTIIDVYGVEDNGAYICNACNITIDTTEIIDTEEFVKGEDGGVIKTREITKDIPIIEKQKEYINNIINTLFEENDTNKNALKQRINIFKLMKSLSNIEMLSIKDEVEMINFIKSYQFDKKDTIYFVVRSKIGTGNIQLLQKIVEKTYLNYLIGDIGARFLIILQTSTINYKLNYTINHKINNNINNKDCNTNIIGYPLINNLDEKDGINYMMCLFAQMAELPEFSTLSEYKEINFIEKIKKQVENDNLIKIKLQTALVNKANVIDNINKFELYYTNYWKEYKPRLQYNEITWHPVKLLNIANLKEVNYNNIDKMINVGIENTMYYSLNIINKINKVINNSIKSNNNMIFNNCCPEKYNEKSYFNYMDYFNKENSDIPKTTNLLKEVSSILSHLKNIVNNNKSNIIYKPLDKQSQTIFKVQFNISNDEIKDMYLKYIDTGINKGKVHIYDKYGRCILSNMKKVDIAAQSYSLQDYKRIEEAVNSGNIINIKNYSDIDTDTDTDTDTAIASNNISNISNINKIEIKKIDELIKLIPNLKIFKYLKDFFNKIKEAENEIFHNKVLQPSHAPISSVSSHTHRGSKLQKHKIEKFDKYKHLGNLKSNIDNEINDLVKKITTTEKNINKYKKIMTNIGDFKELYEDYKINNKNDLNVNEKSNLFRYTKQEEYIQFSIKFLNDVINQIKHNKLASIINKDKVRPQYRDFLTFGENDKLFKLLGENTRTIYDFVKKIKSKQNYIILFPEFVSSILHYLNIISLSNLFYILNSNNISKKESKTVNYNFKILKEQNNEQNHDFYNLKNEINLELEEDVLDEEEDNVNFIESIEIKKSNNLKIVSEFIITYLDYINNNQSMYDELTEKCIKNNITVFDQKKIENNLKVFKTLNEEGNEEKKMLLYMQMNVLKKINYANLSENLDKLFEDDAEGLGDSVDNYEDKAELDNEYIPNKYDNDEVYDNQQMSTVISREDDDEGNQDYNNLAVDDD